MPSSQPTTRTAKRNPSHGHLGDWARSKPRWSSSCGSRAEHVASAKSFGAGGARDKVAESPRLAASCCAPRFLAPRSRAALQPHTRHAHCGLAKGLPVGGDRILVFFADLDCLLDDGSAVAVADTYRAGGFFHVAAAHFLQIFNPASARRFYELRDGLLGFYRCASVSTCGSGT